MVDIDDTIIEFHGYCKQGSGYGYFGVRGLNALLATVTSKDSAPVIVAQRLRKGSCGSPRGAARLVADALKTTTTLAAKNKARALVRADSAFYGHAAVGAALRAGDAWTPIEYTDAVFDEQTRTGSPARRLPRSRSPRSPHPRRPSR